MEIIVPDSVKRNEHRMLMKLSNYNHWDFLSAKTTEKCSGYMCSFHNALLLQGVVLSTSGEVEVKCHVAVRALRLPWKVS
jgi:hypothetical protein